jgi:RHS repeat-associated protein
MSVEGLTGNGFGIVFGKNKPVIDPTQVATSTANFATAYSTQRKLAYFNGKYYLFYWDAVNQDIRWNSTVNQATWSSGFVAGGGSGYGGNIGYNFDLAQSGSTIALTWLFYDSKASGDHTDALYFRTGTLFAGDISWQSPVQVTSWKQPYSWPPSVTIGSDGTFWVGGIWQDSSSHYNVWIYKSTDGSSFSLSDNYLTSSSSSRYEALQLVPLTLGRIMSLTSHYNDQTVRWKLWNPLATNGGSWSSIQSFNMSLPANTAKNNLMSATTTPDGNVHLVFEQHTTTYQIAWSFYNATSGQWTIGPSLYSCANQCLYPTVSSDALGNLYAFWMSLSSGIPTYLIFSTKLYGQNWSPTSQPFGSGTNIQNGIWLSASRSSTKEILVTWTLNTTSPYKIFLGSIPLPSGVSSGPPARPWGKLGLSPYEHYFTQSGEYVSPGNGLVTVSQTDVSIQGRGGMNLAITRVYSQPFSFLQGSPLNYEITPYANLGNGWELNIPWVGPQYLHFLNGEIFPLSWTSFNATSNTWTLANHQTEDFILTKTTNAYTLTMKDGMVYNFNTSGLITSIVDRTGNNQIVFSYTGGLLSTITDTVGRAANLKYNVGNQLANVTYGGQTVRYGYSGNNLITVTDAAGRAIQLKYTGQNSWLLTGVIYTTGGNSTYSYGSVNIGTDVLNYYVTLQNVYNPGQIVKSSSFSYNITDGEVTNTIVRQSDGFTTQGSTTYLFNSRANSVTRTVLNATLVQMLKQVFWYDPTTGRSVQQDIYSGTALSRSFFNSQFYDLWGNVIYARDNTGHESYTSFSNTNSQFMFQSPGSLTATNYGKIFYDDFNGASFNTTAWAQGGQGNNLATSISNSLLKLQVASSSQGTWKADWVRYNQTFNYPIYGEVQTENWWGPGTDTISADLFLSPTLISSTSKPQDTSNYLRFSLRDGPSYKVFDRVGGGSETNKWTGTNNGVHSIIWKFILTDRNTLSVYLNDGTGGFQLVYSTTSLGLSTSFTPTYVYLAFSNLNTTPYFGTFDYVGFFTASSVTVTGLQSKQMVEVYDSNDALEASGNVPSGQTSLTLDGTQLAFPYGYFKIYELDNRTVQFISPTREVWGGGNYSYAKPFRSGGDARTFTGLLQNSSKFVDDSLPSGAVTYADGGDAWVWTSGLVVPPLGDDGASSESIHVSQTVTGTHEHYFNASSTVLNAPSGYYLIQYVYIPSFSVPSEIMLQFHAQGGSWEHRAYWGSNLITACGTSGSTCGTDGTQSRLRMGPLPSITNGWVELVVKTDDVGVNGLNINGWAYTLYNGSAYWDESEIGLSTTGIITMNNLLVGQKVEVYDSTQTLKTSATVAAGHTSVNLTLYGVGINAFPYKAYVKVYSATGSLQYSSPLMTDIWGGDVYLYNQPVFSDSFNFGSISSSIHNDLAGQAQYQNATSIPEESYFGYDNIGDLTQQSQMHNGSPLLTTFTYDIYGNTISQIDADNEKTYYSYLTSYQHAYLTNVTRVLTISANVTTSYAYNFTNGATLSMKDPMANVTKYQYDQIIRVTKIQFAPVSGLSFNSTFIYQDNQNSFSVESAGNRTYFYDGLNRVTRVNFYQGALGTSPVISQQNFTYNWQGQVSTFQDPTGGITTYGYDYFSRLVRVVNPDNTTKTVSYNDVSLMQSNYDENGHRVDYLYSPVNGLIGVRQYYSTTSFYATTYIYDGAGNLAKTIDANGQTTTYSHDDLNRLTLTVFPDGFNETRTYDAIGNLIYKRDPNGKTISYGYDALNRVTSIIYPDSSQASFTYDKNGNRLSLSYLGNSATFIYDSRNRETSETWTIGGSQYTISYAYDQASNLVSITYPDGTNVNYSFDPLNRASLVKTGSTTLATITYRPDSTIANITYGNGVQTFYHYDKRGRPTEIKTTLGQTTLLDLNYGYDAVGNVISIGGETYSYDYLNRLTRSTGPWGTIQYGYDGVGNRAWQYQSPTNTTYTYGLYDRLASVGSTSYTYDNNGNLKTKTVASTTTNYNYDFQNRLTSVSQGSATLGNYTYSALGMRIQKLESGTTTTYVNGGVNVLYEKSVSGSTTINDYVFSGSLKIARLTSGSVYYFHEDLLGSTRLVTTGSTTSFSSNYQPFGTQYGGTGTDPNYKFTGKPQDAATGLYYYAARYYDAGIGRFLTRDPASIGLNPYAYVQDNPETQADPSGLDGCWIFSIICSGALALWNGIVSAGQAVSNWWNSQPGWVKAVIIIVVVAVVIVATVGIAAPYLLPGVVAFLLTGDLGVFGVAFGLGEFAGPITDPCEEDPAACAPPVPPPSEEDTVTSGALPSKIGNLGVKASINRLGNAFIGTEAPIYSEDYGFGRADIVTTDKLIEVKNVQNLYLTNENEIQLLRYVDAVGAENVQYDIYSNYVSPDFIRALKGLGVAYNIYPYIPLPG